MSIREEFEVFIYEHTKAEIYKKTPEFPEGAIETVVREIALVRDGEGYQPKRTQEWWLVWQASRATLSVKSCHTHPELILTDEDRAYEQGVQNQLKAIKAAGITVVA